MRIARVSSISSETPPHILSSPVSSSAHTHSHSSHIIYLYTYHAAPSASNSRSEFPAVPRPSSASTNSRVSHPLMTPPSSDDTAILTLTSSPLQCGSFLRHNTSTLRRLSSITSVTPSVASGKSFVFQKASDTTPHSSHHTDMVR